MTSTAAVKSSIPEFIEKNKGSFVPPVCNKMMHGDGQLKVFFVGGPNKRKDYHIESGEELFLQLKGDLVLKIVEQGRHKDIHISAGKIFLLPGCIPHSPQRGENTMGLVMERERAKTELDGLRYYVEEDEKKTLQPLYEEWFHCDDLSKLGPIINRFFESEQHKTGKPIPGTIPAELPLEIDTTTKVEEPFDINQWIGEHRKEIDEIGFKELFPGQYQFKVLVLGRGNCIQQCPENAQAWGWQWEGESNIIVEGKEFKLSKDDSLLINEGQSFKVQQEAGSILWLAWQDPNKAKHFKKI